MSGLWQVEKKKTGVLGVHYWSMVYGDCFAKRWVQVGRGALLVWAGEREEGEPCAVHSLIEMAKLERNSKTFEFKLVSKDGQEHLFKSTSDQEWRRWWKAIEATAPHLEPPPSGGQVAAVAAAAAALMYSVVRCTEPIQLIRRHLENLLRAPEIICRVCRQRRAAPGFATQSADGKTSPSQHCHLCWYEKYSLGGKDVLPAPQLPVYVPDRQWDAIHDAHGEPSVVDNSYAFDMDPEIAKQCTASMLASMKQERDRVRAAVDNSERVQKRLRKLGLRELEVADDGACQFRAVSRALYGSQKYHMALRLAAVADGKVRFSDYADPEYFAAMQHAGTWGEELTLKAMSEVTGVVIRVILSLDVDQWIRDYTPSNTCHLLVEDPVVLTYKYPVHYNTVSVARDETATVLHVLDRLDDAVAVFMRTVDSAISAGRGGVNCDRVQNATMRVKAELEEYGDFSDLWKQLVDMILKPLKVQSTWQRKFHPQRSLNLAETQIGTCVDAPSDAAASFRCPGMYCERLMYFPLLTPAKIRCPGCNALIKIDCERVSLQCDPAGQKKTEQRMAELWQQMEALQAELQRIRALPQAGRGQSPTPQGRCAAEGPQHDLQGLLLDGFAKTPRWCRLSGGVLEWWAGIKKPCNPTEERQCAGRVSLFDVDHVTRDGLTFQLSTRGGVVYPFAAKSDAAACMWTSAIAAVDPRLRADPGPL